jgi:hypothetical protein
MMPRIKLKRAYSLRDKYLHGYGDPSDKTSWKDLASIRWAVARTVDRYVMLSEAKSEYDRRSLLKALSKA